MDRFTLKSSVLSESLNHRSQCLLQTRKKTVPTDGNLRKLVMARNHVSTIGNDSDDYSDLLSNKHLIVFSSSDEEPSPQSSDKDDSFDMDPNIYPLCSTPNNSLQRVDNFTFN